MGNCKGKNSIGKLNYQIIITPEAEKDLDEAFEWYEDNSPGLGIDFLNCVDESLKIIGDTPDIYQKVYKNIRRALTHRFPYGIFYIIEEGMIIVLAIFHAKRDPKIWKKRYPTGS